MKTIKVGSQDAGVDVTHSEVLRERTGALGSQQSSVFHVDGILFIHSTGQGHTNHLQLVALQMKQQSISEDDSLCINTFPLLSGRS